LPGCLFRDVQRWWLAFRARQSEAANIMYTQWEREVPEGSGPQVVLVSVDSIANLKRAYPNYFLDTTRFAEIVTQALQDEYPDPQQFPVAVAA
jgi:hypothetical protein